jgi:hypothetical protein
MSAIGGKRTFESVPGTFEILGGFPRPPDITEIVPNIASRYGGADFRLSSNGGVWAVGTSANRHDTGRRTGFRHLTRKLSRSPAACRLGRPGRPRDSRADFLVHLLLHVQVSKEIGDVTKHSRSRRRTFGQMSKPCIGLQSERLSQFLPNTLGDLGI